MRRKLSDSVSASEMMRLRGEGLSNQGIADILGISRQTVHQYIGKQGRYIGRQKAFEDRPKAEPQQAAPRRLELELQCETLGYVTQSGELLTAILPTGDDTVTIETVAHGAIHLHKGDLEEAALFFTALAYRAGVRHV